MTAAPENAGGIEVLHAAVPGRLRLRVPGLRLDRAVMAELEQSLSGMPGVAFVDARPATGTLVVRHDPAVEADDIVGALARLAAAARPAVPESGPRSTRSDAVAGSDTTWHARSLEDVLAELDTSREAGLTSEDARARLERHGPNTLGEARPLRAWPMLVGQITNVPVAMLGASAATALATGGRLDAAFIGAVVALNAGIGFATEWQSEKTIRALAPAGPERVNLVRDGVRRALHPDEIVVGDLLEITHGTPVTADARLVRASELAVDESSLTGESMPADKSADAECGEDTPLADRDNMVFCGTTATAGSGRAAVVATGRATEIGRIQAAAGAAETPETPVQRQLDRLGTQLAWASGLACAAVLGLGLLRARPLLELVRSTISLAVAAVPEGLPTVATTTLALGIRKMRQERVAVRTLGAVEALGEVDTLCLDKTGTLTENRMMAVAAMVGRTACRPDSAEELGVGLRHDLDGGERFLEALALCSDAEVTEDGEVRGSATETALTALARDAGLDVPAIRARHPREDTRYRTDEEPWMATLHGGRGRRLAIKGSPDLVLERCTRIRIGGRTRKLGDEDRKRIRKQNQAWAADALRVLGVAEQTNARSIGGGDGWTWLGLAAITDPIREGLPALIRQVQAAGLRTIMITGDQAATAEAVARQLGIAGDEPVRVLESRDLSRLPPDVLKGLAPRTHVFARVSPVHKLEIVQALQQSGRTVAMTGDGVNDGPALKVSNVGIAMVGGDGNEGARAVADIVIQDNELRTLLKAIALGRTTYANIRNAIHYLLATNMSEIELMLAASAAGLATPLNPMQLLWINLLTDVFPSLALAVEREHPGVLQSGPRSPDTPLFDRQGLKRLFGESLAITGPAFGAYAASLLRTGDVARAGTTAFTSLTLGQLGHAYLCRPPHAEGRNRALDAAVLGGGALQLATLALPPLRRLLGTTPLGFLDLALAAGGAAAGLAINRRRRHADETAPQTSGSD